MFSVFVFSFEIPVYLFLQAHCTEHTGFYQGVSWLGLDLLLLLPYLPL